MKCIAYYRTRPSEPEASTKALRAQQEAVAAMLAECNASLAAAFTEQEGEVDGYPAYEAALQKAVAISGAPDVIDVTLIIASHQAIGTGEAFYEPTTEEQTSVITMHLNALLDPALVEIELPKSAPPALSLYAMFDPKCPDTLLYLCNGTAEDLTDVEAVVDFIDMSQFFDLSPSERWTTSSHMAKKSWSVVPVGRCVLLGARSHVVWDQVHRVRLAFIDGSGERHTADAIDLNLVDVEEDQSRAWELFNLRT